MNPPHTLHAPIAYAASMEVIAPDEADTIAALKHELLKISQTVLEDSGHAMRSVHAKSHGLLQGRLTVLSDLPPTLAQGIFAEPRTYPVTIRLSTPPGDVLPDSVSVPRALAMKVFDVPGARLPGAESESTQDFILADGPAFLAPDAKHFLSSLKLLAATTDKAEGLKKAFSAALRGTERLIEGLGGESQTLKALGGHPMTHILGETFYSQVPMLYGDHMAKVSLVPVSPALVALTGQALDLQADADGLRTAVSEFFREQSGEWEFRVQLCTDLETMPIEDASVVWPEDMSPYVTVARLTVGPQASWEGAASLEAEQQLAFSPWHGVIGHRPLGSVMRARQETYRASAAFRSRGTGCPMGMKTIDADDALPVIQPIGPAPA